MVNHESHEIRSAAYRELYTTITDAFEGPFAGPGYSLEYGFVPEASSGVYADREMFQLLEAYELGAIDPNIPWRVTFAYDARTDGPALDSISLPIANKTGDCSHFRLQRFSHGYFLPLLDDKGTESQVLLDKNQRLDERVFGQYTSVAYPKDAVLEVLAKAGHLILSLPHDKEGIRTAMAELLTPTTEWTRMERRVVPVAADGSQVVFERKMTTHNNPNSTDVGEVLDAYIENVAEDGSRSQLQISFTSSGHMISQPYIQTRRLVPAQDPHTIVRYGPNAYEVTEAAAVTDLFADVTRYLTDELKEALA